MKKVLQLHTCWNFSITKLLCMSRKTCDAQTIKENTTKMRLAGRSCMTEGVCLACLASECVTVTLFSHDIDAAAGFSPSASCFRAVWTANMSGSGNL